MKSIKDVIREIMNTRKGKSRHHTRKGKSRRHTNCTTGSHMNGIM